MQVGLDKLGISCLLRKDNQLVIRVVQQQARNPARQWLVNESVLDGIQHDFLQNARLHIQSVVFFIIIQQPAITAMLVTVMDESAAHAPVHERLSTHFTESHQRSCSSGTHVAVAVKQEAQDISWWDHWDLQANSRNVTKACESTEEMSACFV